MTPQDAQTQRGHRTLSWIVGALLLLGFVAAVFSVVCHARDNGSFTWDQWSTGQLRHEIDHAVDVPYTTSLQHAQAAIGYRLFGYLGTQVKEGCPGWLFYADGLHPATAHADGSSDKIIAARIATAANFAQALKQQGIQLVVVTVPDKARVEAKTLCGLSQSDVMNRRLVTWQQALQAMGVTQIALLAPLQQARPAFFKTDVHWNAFGAEAAARTIAPTLLRSLGGRGTQDFSVQDNAPSERVGDLLTLANLAQVSNAWRPLPDQVVEQKIAAIHSGGLLDEVAPPEVLLAGSSFSMRSNFAERLGRQLGREVWNVSVDDGRFDRALQAAWKQRASWPSSVRILIWEMSEDALSLPVGS
jgi:alginate O-acetyltransferase complex protein AlgJ